MMQKIAYIFFALFLLSSCCTTKNVASRQADELVSYATTFLNTPYRSGGTTPQGFDCSGYVQYVYRKFGYPLPRTVHDQIKQGLNVNNNKLNKGDLVFFKGRDKTSKTAGHVGIVVQPGKKKNGQFLFIHASNRGVVIDDSRQNYYEARYIRAKRIIY